MTVDIHGGNTTGGAGLFSVSFSKEGRKISIGDCALFRPPQDSPPFIGIIHRLFSGEEENRILSVNWLYRSADVKLGKGASVEAAPNEVFYSFHKDEIPAASLLHPCKIAFLRKGVELPSGISSFVCRRVYDVENNCLWWLTDQDYINDRQDEIDQLLQKTRLDMYGAVQSGGRSPKVLNGTTGIQQLRSGSDSAHKTICQLPSQIKTKKRDRVDQGTDPVKKERLSTADDTDLGQFRADLKSEIAKITDNGGLVGKEAVEKLVQLMQSGSAEKKIDLSCKMLLVDVIAVTDKFDFLGRFVQLRGLPVLDEWLQEVHKGKVGDGSSPKESEKSVDEFLLVLLVALDKLPVNLHALQTCNIGKSVNHLRTHKNIEIQKKARSLVDTWKRRVEAEMNSLDPKSSSWPNTSMLPEVSSRENRRNAGPFHVSEKNSIEQSLSKMPCAKFGSIEAVAKVVPASPNSSKSIASNMKDPISVALTSSDSLSAIKEEKSSNCSHSQNNSRSYLSDHRKTGCSKEDPRSHTAGLVSGTKISISSSHHRTLSYSFQGSTLSSVQKETNCGKISLNKNLGSEKASPPGGTQEKVCDMAVSDHGNRQRPIVRLPNTGRSPGQSSTGYDGPTALSTISPTEPSVKFDHYVGKVKEKSDALRFDIVSKDGVEDKNVFVRLEEGILSSPGNLSSDKKQSAEAGEKVMNALKGTGFSSGYEPRDGNLYDASFKAMYALVESCAKLCEANTIISDEDLMGMNLLASVAAGEMSRSDGSASVSRGMNLHVPDESCSGNDASSKHIDEDTAQCQGPSCNGVSTFVQDNSIGLHLRFQSSDDVIRLSSVDASVGIASEDVLATEIEKDGGAGEFHDHGMSGTAQSEVNKDMIANRTSEKKLEDSALKLPETSAGTKLVMEKAISVSGMSLETGGGKTDDTNAASQIEQTEKQNGGISLSVSDQTKDLVEKSDKGVLIHCPDKCLAKESDKGVLIHCPDKCLAKESTTVQAEKSVKLNEVVIKLDFDLNEGFDVDDECEEEIVKSLVQRDMSTVQLPFPVPLPLSSTCGSYSASVTIASAAKGSFYPPEKSFKSKGELGWKGSAATSAFRPAEPRKTLDCTTDYSPVDNRVSKQGRPHLDFDLNIADKSVLESERRDDGLDLDLNRVDESCEVQKLSLNNGRNMGICEVFNKPLPSGGFPMAERKVSRDFDLNSGPCPDDTAMETAARPKSNVSYLSPLSGVRFSGSDQGSQSSWFSQGSSYQPMAISSVFHNRGEHGQRIMGRPAGTASSVPELYRGQVLSSSHAPPFPTSVPFQYPFQFENNFSMPSHSNPSIRSRLVGPGGMVSSHYPRAYIMNIPGDATNTGQDSWRWVGQGLDLNSGPGNVEVGRRDEMLSSALRQTLVPGSQAFSSDEQLRMYQMAGGSLKRKDHDGGWDGERTNYKRLPPWQ